MLKVSYFRSITVKCISWHIFNEIVENQDLYRNFDDLWKNLKSKVIIFYIKDFIQYICKMMIFSMKLQKIKIYLGIKTTFEKFENTRISKKKCERLTYRQTKRFIEELRYKKHIKKSYHHIFKITNNSAIRIY